MRAAVVSEGDAAVAGQTGQWTESAFGGAAPGVRKAGETRRRRTELLPAWRFHILPPDLSEAAQWRLLEMVYADRGVLLISLVLSLLVGGMVWTGMRTPLAAAWAISGVALNLHRVFAWRVFEKLRARNALPAAKRRFFVQACIISLHWGAASFVLTLRDNTIVWLWLLNAQAGFLVFAVARNHPVASVCYVMVALVVTPLMAACLLSTHAAINLYGSLDVLFLIGCLGTIRNLNGRTMRLVRSDEENALLLRRLSEANSRLEVANSQLQAVATTDALTGIANRFSFDVALARAWAGEMRDGGAVGLILLDVDLFKPFNDRFGHQAGDVCLRQVAQCIAANALRPDDVAARYGGEEFAVILPKADLFGVIDTAERMRAAVEALDIPAARGGPVTVSAGAALLGPAAGAAGDAEPAGQAMLARLIEAADRKLYEAKAAGRNRVRVDGQEIVTCNKAPP